MTLKELSRLYYLNREIEMDKRRLQELEVKAVSCTASLSGMPHGASVSDCVGRYAAEIVDLKGVIEVKLQQCIYERSRLERYIAALDNSLLRQVFTYRFVNGLPLELLHVRDDLLITVAAIGHLSHAILSGTAGPEQYADWGKLWRLLVEFTPEEVNEQEVFRC